MQQDAADAEGDVQRQGAGGDDLDRLGLGVPETHDGPLAMGALDLGQGRREGSLPLRRHRLRLRILGRGRAPPGELNCTTHGTTCLCTCQRYISWPATLRA